MSFFSRWPAGWFSGWLVGGLAAALLWTGCLGLAGAQGVLPLPALSGRVIDQTGTLDSAELAGLTAKLAQLEQTRGTQVVLLLVPTTAPEDITDYTQRLGDAWKIGRRDVGDGVLFVVAKNDRRLRIAPAKTLEGALPDLLAKRIIDEVVTPAFRQGDYAGGLNAGIDRLAGVIAGEGLPVPQTQTSGDGGMDQGLGLEGWLMLLLFAGPMAAAALRRVFGAPMGAMLAGAGAGALAWWLSQAWWLAAAAGMVAAVATLFLQLLPSLPSSGAGRGRKGGWHGPSGGIGGGGWGGGGWSGSGGGGGFSSGGGGDFGGGGASGSW